MQLTLAHHPITQIRFGAQTRLEGTVLVVDDAELRRLVLEEESVAAVEFDIVRPGDKCRAGPIFDIVEPRAKEPDSGPDFPGILGAPTTQVWARPTCFKAAQFQFWLRCRPARGKKRDGTCSGDEWIGGCRERLFVFASSAGHPSHPG
ncbi:MAG: glycine/sarcosine/betaine reductase component B subunit [Candidatus Binatia bacterium]